MSDAEPQHDSTDLEISTLCAGEPLTVSTLKYTNNAVCPHCYHEHIDSWELGGDEFSDEFDMDCMNCESMFHVSRDISVTYTTKKPSRGKT